MNSNECYEKRQWIWKIKKSRVKKFLHNQLVEGGTFCLCVIYSINPFHGTSLFLYPQKASQNLRFSDVFRGYWKASDIWKVREVNWAVVNITQSSGWTYEVLRDKIVVLREKCPYSEFFRFVFSRIRNECGEILHHDSRSSIAIAKIGKH